MERTSRGTPVGVDDPHAHAGRCDHLTGDGQCRLAAERPGQDLGFARARAAEDYACPAARGDWQWADCPHFRSRTTARSCARCGLEERRDGQGDARPLLEEHHLSYAGDGSVDHEITVALCRWCHAKVHGSWGRIDDDVGPAPEAIAAREGRRSAELEELAFRTAADRREEG